MSIVNCDCLAFNCKNCTSKGIYHSICGMFVHPENLFRCILCYKSVNDATLIYQSNHCVCKECYVDRKCSCGTKININNKDVKFADCVLTKCEKCEENINHLLDLNYKRNN